MAKPKPKDQRPVELSLLNSAEVARRLNLESVARISQLVAEKKLKPVTTIGRSMLFDPKDVEALKQARIAALLKQVKELKST